MRLDWMGWERKLVFDAHRQDVFRPTARRRGNVLPV
jgi:hypothetical protein